MESTEYGALRTDRKWVKSDNEEKIEGTFEDLLKMVGTMGKMNLLYIVLIAYTGFVTGIDALSYGFLGKTPNYHCQNEFLQKANWTTEQKLRLSAPAYTDGQIGSCKMYDAPYEVLYTMDYATAQSYMDEAKQNFSAISCEHREFESGIYTTVTEWDLVCDRRILYSTTQSAVQMGKLLGSVIFGQMSDRIGRKTTYTICACGIIISSLSFSFSPDIWTFIILRIICATFGMGAILSSHVLKMEMLLTKHRTAVACLSGISWALSLFYIAAVAYYVRTWYYLQILLALPAFALLFGVWQLPESPRWLIVNGKYEKSFHTLQNFAKWNKKPPLDKSNITKIMKTIHEEHLLASQQPQLSKEENNFLKRLSRQINAKFILVLDSRFRITTFAIFYCWFAVSLVYYGISLGSPSPGTAINDYAYMAMGGATELLVPFITLPLLLYFGRKKTLASFYLTCSISIFAAMFLIMFEKNLEYVGLTWFLYVLGRLTISGSFTVIFLYTVELYPTNYRTMALGDASTVARISSIFSSYVNDLLGEVIFWAPAALFGTISGLSALAIMTLPETMHKDLPDFASRKRTSSQNIAMDSNQ